MMKTKINTALVKGIILISSAALITACTTGGGGLPARKKMPEFNSYSDGFEGAVPFEKKDAYQPGEGFAFNTSNVDVMLNGVPQGFVAVSLPNAANDSLAINLVNNFKPFALPLISQWARDQHKGVAIDLSSHNGGEIHRSDFVLRKADDFSIPVIVMWDAASASRVTVLQSLANSMPSVQFNKTAGADSPAFGR